MMNKAISSIGKVSVRQLVCWVGADGNGVHWNVMEDDGAQPEGAEETARLIADLLNKHAAQEVAAPTQADPFMPDEWPYSEYDWITHDASGAIVYWGSCPAVTSDGWTPWSEVDDFLEVGFRDLTGLDWRNSLRHRPDGA